MIPLFVELCAGTAALSLRLHRDGARPPVSRMGAKTGYADAILRVLGLYPGQRAERYLWCEPDPGVRLLLHAYRDATLAKAAATIIRSWKDEDPRALWERLRAEGPPRLPEGEVEAGEVARFAQIVASNRLINVSWNDAEGRWANTGKGGTTFGGAEFATSCEHTAEGLDATPADLPAVVAPDAREVDPREVARLLYMAPVAARPDCIDTWNADAKLGGDDLLGRGTVPDVAHKLIVQQGASVALADLGCPVSDLVADVDRLGGPREVVGPVVAAQAVQVARNHSSRTGPVERLTDKGADAPMDAATSAAHDQLSIAVLVNPASQGPVGIDRLDLPHVADHVLGSLGDDPPFFSHMDTSTATISYGGASVQLPPGTVCYMDPSYVGTTGYADNLSRPEVVALARRWADAGATVAISEAESIPELVAEGWYSVRIDGERNGVRRVFSKQQTEWLTINRPPAWVPPVQVSLFG